VERHGGLIVCANGIFPSARPKTSLEDIEE
jgi:hypothetical protein